MKNFSYKEHELYKIITDVMHDQLFLKKLGMSPGDMDNIIGIIHRPLSSHLRKCSGRRMGRKCIRIHTRSAVSGQNSFRTFKFRPDCRRTAFYAAIFEGSAQI